jgi:hypothetical protein
MGSAINERPMCPTCKHRMALLRISPGTRGALRTAHLSAPPAGELRGSQSPSPLEDECCGLARQRASPAALTLF